MKLCVWMRWITAVATLLIVALLCWQCIDIYLVGNAPENLDANGVHLSSVYRMEDVAARLSRFSVPLIAYVALLIVTGIAHLSCASEPSTRKGMTPENRLRLLKFRVAELTDAAKSEERFRRHVWIAAGVIIAACAAICLVYLLDGTNFTSWDLETVMGNMMLHVAPWVLIAFLAAIAAALVCARSTERELAALKGAPVSPKSTEPVQKGSRVNVIRITLYALAALFIVLGVMNGGLRDVLVKAINICTECIGLG